MIRKRPPWQIVLGVVGAFGVTVQAIFGLVSGSIGLLVGIAFALLALWALGILGALGQALGKAIERWGYVPRHRYEILEAELERTREQATQDYQALQRDTGDN
jgi:hypothetical protein